MSNSNPSTVWLLVDDDIAGHYHLEGEAAIFFGTRYKPNWWHRTMMRLMLGFRWQPFSETMRARVATARNIQ